MLTRPGGAVPPIGGSVSPDDALRNPRRRADDQAPDVADTDHLNLLRRLTTLVRGRPAVADALLEAALDGPDAAALDRDDRRRWCEIIAIAESDGLARPDQIRRWHEINARVRAAGLDPMVCRPYTVHPDDADLSAAARALYATP